MKRWIESPRKAVPIIKINSLIPQIDKKATINPEIIKVLFLNAFLDNLMVAIKIIPITCYFDAEIYKQKPRSICNKN